MGLVRTKTVGGHMEPQWNELHMINEIPQVLEVHVYSPSFLGSPTYCGSAIIECSPNMKPHERSNFKLYEKSQETGEICLSITPMPPAAAPTEETESAKEVAG